MNRLIYILAHWKAIFFFTLPILFLLLFFKKTVLISSFIFLILLFITPIAWYDTCGGFCFVHDGYLLFLIIILCNLFAIALHIKRDNEKMHFRKKCLCFILCFLWVLLLLFYTSVRGNCYCAGAKPASAENNFKFEDTVKQGNEEKQVETIEQKGLDDE